VSKLTPTEALAAADIAREAARLVARPGGWCQRDLSTPQGAVCAYEALHRAANGRTGTWGHYLASSEAHLRIGGGIMMWNDAAERQQHEVVELFESIAKHFDREASRIGDGD
jgi:hypothetical protein